VTITTVVEGTPQFFGSLSAEDFPAGLPAGVRFLRRGNNFGVVFDGLVGSIALANGETLRIQPKVGDANFLYMLFRADGDSHLLRDRFAGVADYAVSNEATVSSPAARHLVASADQILRRGMLTDRIRVHRRQSSIGGRVDASQTALASSRREADPVSTHIRVKTANGPENRIILEALRRSVGLLASDAEGDFAASVLTKWAARVIQTGHIERDLGIVERRAASNFYSGPRSYYTECLLLARIVLGSLGFASHGRSEVSAEAFLINTADVYERYLRRVIAEHYGPKGYLVAKSGPVKRSLYLSGDHELNPDIVIWKSGNIWQILDAKYKSPTSGDHYQALAYLRAFDCDAATLLSPANHGQGLAIKSYSTLDGKTVREVFLPIGDIQTTENFLGELF